MFSAGPSRAATLHPEKNMLLPKYFMVDAWENIKTQLLVQKYCEYSIYSQLLKTPFPNMS